MDIRRTTAGALTAALAVMVPLAAHAQQGRWSVEGRIGAAIPTGDLTEGPAGQTAGLAFAGDVMYTLSTNFTVYGGAGHVRFNCDDCDADLSTTGFDGGVKLLFGSNRDAMPWVRAGLLLHRFDVEGVDGDWEVGVDSGVGIDWMLNPDLTLVPALRFDRYGTNGSTFSWFTIDLGAHFHLGG